MTTVPEGDGTLEATASRPGMFTEDNGKPSSMRLISLLLALAAIGLAGNEAALAWAGQAEQGNMTLVLYFLGASIGGKIGQKFMEQRSPG